MATFQSAVRISVARATLSRRSFSGTAANPVFTTGTFNLSGIVSGASTLTISSLVSAAPEPGTSMMMILGFGMAGAGLRYRRRSMSVSYS